MSPAAGTPDPSLISADALRTLLRTLARDGSVRHSPMADCRFVRRSLERAGFSATPEARVYELGRLVTEEVAVELGRLRALAGVPASSDPLEAIRADFAQESPVLEGWSALYYLCLQPELGFDLPGLCDQIEGMHRRTMQRRLRRGTRLLAAHLREREHEAIRAERQERLWSALPRTSARRLQGRDEVLDLLTGAILSGEPRLLALAGPPGCGKSALLRVAAERAVVDGGFDHLVWIEAGDGTVEELRHRIDDAWRRRPPSRLLLLVDAVDRPSRAGLLAAARAQVPPRVAMLASGRVGWHAWPNLRVVDLPPLERRAALALLRQELRDRGMRDLAAAPAADLSPLISAAAGQPLVLVRAVAALRAASLQRVTEDILQGRGMARELCAELWAPVWDRLGREARLAVRAVIASGRGGAPATTTVVAGRAGLSPEAASAALCEAIDRGLLERVEGARRCCFHARPWLRRYLAGLDGARASAMPRMEALPLEQSAD